MSFPFKLPFLLDGATGTNLMKAGMPKGVCTEQWILDNPDALIKIQKDFISAGSNAILVPTFGANRARLDGYGLGDCVDDYNKRLTALTKQAADGQVLVGGDLSPTGLFIEPFGDATFDDIISIYREQIAALSDSGVDFLLCETLMSLSDARAAVLAANEANIPIMVSFTIEGNGRTISGTSLLPALITLQSMGAIAVGLNCSTGPAAMADSIIEALPHASVPLLAKPNAGLIDSDDGGYLDPEQFAAEIGPLIDAGVLVVGGCCGSTPAHITALRRLLDDVTISASTEPDDFAAACETDAFFLGDDLNISEPLECDYGLEDALIEIEDEQINAVRLHIHSPDDAAVMAECIHMARLPLCLLADNAHSLECALKLYQGRAIVDSESDIDRGTLENIAAKYGAILY